MMLTFIYLLAGVVLALVYLWTARRIRLIGEMTNYKIGLIVAALIYGHCKNKYPVSKAFAMAQAISLDTFYFEIAYIGFAVTGGVNDCLWFEVLGVVLYGGIALFGLRWSVLLIALGWGAHPLWDAVVHPLQTTQFVPIWCAWACIGFDLIMAAYLVWQWWSRQKVNQEIRATPTTF